MVSIHGCLILLNKGRHITSLIFVIEIKVLSDSHSFKQQVYIIVTYELKTNFYIVES